MEDALVAEIKMLVAISDSKRGAIGLHPVRLIVAAMLISHDIVFLFHNKTASAGL